MCFSSAASFSAATVLGSVGAVSLKRATNKSQYMFASIPLLFGIQQAIEGILWISLTHLHYSYWQPAATCIFLFFAIVVWTTWVPLSFLLLEADPFRKKLLRIVSVLGIFTSCFLGYRLIAYDVSAEISGHHIYYDVPVSRLSGIANGVMYIVAVILPCFISGIKKTKTLGIILVSSLLVSRFFYQEYLISVWCFFAAVLSMYIFSIVKDFER